ncbi:MAG TPA: hypothetical protein VGN69_10255 [Solirubrobacteraceae bacterium]|jgi:O-antigen/teichoic acid export membrane protein|nr:hypothetical protein [Solirubrobacteraceae bacterium]
MGGAQIPSGEPSPIPAGLAIMGAGGGPPGPRLLRSGAIVSAAAVTASAMNVILHLGLARLLAPREYSLLATIFAIQAVATVPLVAVQATVARRMAPLLHAGELAAAGQVLRLTLSTLGRWVAAAAGVGVVIAYPVALLVAGGHPLVVVATLVVVVVAVPLPAAWGALQAGERFGVLNLAQLTGTIAKLGLGLGLAALGLGAIAITFATAATLVASAAIGLYQLRPLLARARARAGGPTARIIGGYAAAAAAVLGLQTGLTQSDLIWSRAGLAVGRTGDYAAASVATGLLLLVPTGVITVLFARVARLPDRGSARRHLLGGLVIVGAVAAIGVVVMALAPRALLDLAFGSRYEGAAPWLAPLGAAMGLYALSTVYINHFLAVGATGFWRWLAGVFVAQQALFALLHATGDQIVAVQLASSATLLLACELFERFGRRAGPGVEVAPAQPAPG